MNLNLPGPVNYATQNGRPCPCTGIFFCKATSAEDRNLQPPKALNTERTPPKHALARAVEYTALGTGVRAEARPIAHFLVIPSFFNDSSVFLINALFGLIYV